MWKKVVLVIILAFIAKTCIDIYNDVNQETENNSNIRVFSADELKSLTTDKLLYLSILGSVYDVSKGAKHYAPGGSYAFFTGIDGSRAFITGDFKVKIKV
jgi:cytochrome b involved in lipid metabolism